MPLNEGQQAFANAVMAGRGSGMPRHIACAGGGGTGKTKVTKHLIELARGNVHEGRPDVSVHLLSPTNRGIANYRTGALQGITIHTNDGFLKTGGKRVSDIPWAFQKLLAGGGWNSEHFGPPSHTGCAVFVVDEAWSMSAEVANLLLRAAELLYPAENTPRFMFVLVGDPLQLPPVDGESFWLSRFWCPARGDRPTVLKMLTENMRQDKNAWFARAATSLRLPANHRRPADQLMYENSLRRYPALPVGSTMTLVYTNKQCLDINAAELKRAEAAGKLIVAVSDKGTRVQTFYVDGPVIVVGPGTIPAVGADGDDTLLPNGTLARLVGAQDPELDHGGWVDIKVPSMDGGVFRLTAAVGGLPLERGDALTVHKLQGETLVALERGGGDRLVIDGRKLPRDPDEAVALLYVGLTRAGVSMGQDAVVVRNYAPGSIFGKGKPVTKDDRRVQTALEYFRGQELISTQQSHAGKSGTALPAKRRKTLTSRA